MFVLVGDSSVNDLGVVDGVGLCARLAECNKQINTSK